MRGEERREKRREGRSIMRGYLYLSGENLKGMVENSLRV
jgi:hypothetical protein